MKGLLRGEGVGMLAGLGVVLTAALTLWTAPAAGQPSPFMGGTQGSFRPDFLRRDLVRLAEDLRLDEDQKLVVETLFSDYEAAFDKGVEDVRGRIGLVRPAPVELTEEQRQAQQELRDGIRALLAEAREKAGNAATAEERRQIMEQYQQRVREMREQMMGTVPVQRDLAANAEMEAEINRQLEVWRAKKAQLKDEFAAGVQAVLREEQRALWPVYERKMRREKTIARGQLSGESVDLFRIVRQLDLPAEAGQAIASVLEAYDVRLDAALKARNDYLAESQQRLTEAMTSANHDGAMSILDRQLTLSQTVFQVNEEYRQAVAAALPGQWGTQFTDAFNEMAFPRVYRSNRTQRLFEAALELDGLEEGTLAAIRQLQQSFLSELAARNEQIRQLIVANEPVQIRRRFERRVPQGGPAGYQRPEDPIQDAYEARREFEDQYIAQLRELLTEEQFDRLPGARRGPGARGAPGAGEGWDRRGRGAGPGQEGSLLDRFDEDGDGRLSEAEREALREYLRQRRRGGDDGR